MGGWKGEFPGSDDKFQMRDSRRIVFKMEIGGLFKADLGFDSRVQAWIRVSNGIITPQSFWEKSTFVLGSPHSAIFSRTAKTRRCEWIAPLSESVSFRLQSMFVGVRTSSPYLWLFAIINLILSACASALCLLSASSVSGDEMKRRSRRRAHAN